MNTAVLESCSPGTHPDDQPRHQPHRRQRGHLRLHSMGPWTEPICRESHSIDLELDDLLAGVQDNAALRRRRRDRTRRTRSRRHAHRVRPASSTAGGCHRRWNRGCLQSPRHPLRGVRDRCRSPLRHRPVHAVVRTRVRRVNCSGWATSTSPRTKPTCFRALGQHLHRTTRTRRPRGPVHSIGRWNLRLLSTHQVMDEQEGFRRPPSAYMPSRVALGDVGGDGHVGVAISAVIGTHRRAFRHAGLISMPAARSM